MTRFEVTMLRSAASHVFALAIFAFIGSSCVRGGKKKASASSKSSMASILKRVPVDFAKGVLPQSAIQGGNPIDGGNLTVRLPAEPPTLNYMIEPDLWLQYITLGNIYEPLIIEDPHDDPDYKIIPWLAEKFEVSPNHLIYTFHLRKDVKWADGKPFTSDDCLFTFDMMMDPNVRSISVRNYFEDLKSWKAQDPYTFVLTFAKPYFLAADSIAGIGIFPRHVFEKPGIAHDARYLQVQGDYFNTESANRSPVGTGPFKFDHWTNKTEIVLDKNPLYWGHKAHVDRIDFRIITDNTVARQMLDKGEIDIDASPIPADIYYNLPRDPMVVANYYRTMIPQASYDFIGWNEHTPYFADARVRQAMSYGARFGEFLHIYLHDLYPPCTCQFYRLSMDCDFSLKPYPYNPDKAAQLLDAAGWKMGADGVRHKDGKAFRFTFLYPAESQTAGALALVMKEDYQKLGIAMDIAKMEWATFSHKLRDHDFDAVTLGWGGGPRQDPYQIWHSSQAKDGSNYVFFNNPEADRLMVEARTEFDDRKRQALYRQLDDILWEEQPYTFLWSPDFGAVFSKKLHGITENLSFIQFNELWIDPSWRAGAVVKR